MNSDHDLLLQINDNVSGIREVLGRTEQKVDTSLKNDECLQASITGLNTRVSKLENSRQYDKGFAGAIALVISWFIGLWGR